MSLLNPYSYIAGAVALAAIGGTFYYQSTQIHHFHTQYDGDEVIIGQLKQRITDMTKTQNTQTGKSEQNVIKVVQGPKETQTIIREIAAAPLGAGCTSPTYSSEITNAF